MTWSEGGASVSVPGVSYSADRLQGLEVSARMVGTRCSAYFLRPVRRGHRPSGIGIGMKTLCAIGYVSLEYRSRSVACSQKMRNTRWRRFRADLDKPYGLLGQWQTASKEAEIVAVEPRDGLTPAIPGEGPLLMSIKDTATHLGIPSGRVYELVNTGEIDHVRVGRRTYISRDAVSKFIETNTPSGYQGRFPP